MLINIIYDNTFDAKLASALIMSGDEDYASYQYEPNMDVSGRLLILIGKISQSDIDSLSKNHKNVIELVKYHKASQSTEVRYIKDTYTSHVIKDVNPEIKQDLVDMVNSYYDVNNHEYVPSLLKVDLERIINDSSSFSDVWDMLVEFDVQDMVMDMEHSIGEIKRSANADYFYCMCMSKRAIAINSSVLEYCTVHNLMEENQHIDLFVVYKREGIEKYRVKFFHRTPRLGEKMASIHRNPSHYVYEPYECIVRNIDTIVK